MCCVDACSSPPVAEDILLDGTKLTRVVRQGLPDGVTAALELTGTGSGAIRQQRTAPLASLLGERRRPPLRATLPEPSASPRAHSFVQVGTRPGVHGAPAFSIACSSARRSVSTSVFSVASCFSKASAAIA